MKGRAAEGEQGREGMYLTECFLKKIKSTAACYYIHRNYPMVMLYHFKIEHRYYVQIMFSSIPAFTVQSQAMSIKRYLANPQHTYFLYERSWVMYVFSCTEEQVCLCKLKYHPVNCFQHRSPQSILTTKILRYRHIFAK